MIQVVLMVLYYSLKHILHGLSMCFFLIDMKYIWEKITQPRKRPIPKSMLEHFPHNSLQLFDVWIIMLQTKLIMRVLNFVLTE